MIKRPPKPQGKCPDCGKNLYREANESNPTGPEDTPYTFYTLDCEDQQGCGYWRHDDPDDTYSEA